MTARHRFEADRQKDPYRHAITRFVHQVASLTAPGAVVLDAGAGDAGYGYLFGRHRYIACDMVVGAPHLDHSSLDVICDLTHLPFQTGSIQVALCTETLEHLAEPLAALAELWRVLEPGGAAYFSVPFLTQGLHQEPHDYYRFTEHALRQLLGRAGFRLESLETNGRFFTTFAIYFRMLGKRLFPRSDPWPRRLRRWPAKLVYKALRPLVVSGMLKRDEANPERAFPGGYLCVCRKPHSGAAGR